MYFTTADIKNFDESKLREFLNLAIREGHYIDYKVALSGDSDREQKIEFLKDITAFANAAGGDILIGVKEPSEGLSVNDQLVGIAGGEQVATDLERVAASSIDPRIPGLQLKPISISGLPPVIIAHAPPSLSRPHRVTYQKHIGFYIRHSESSLPMTTHEIRESVLASATSEGAAKAYLHEQELLLRRYQESHFPVIFMQAMPLIALEQRLDVLGEAIRRTILQGGERNQIPGSWGLMCHSEPTPTIDGVTWRSDRQRGNYIVEVHRNGYLSAVFFNDKDKIGRTEEHLLTPYHCNLFKAFCLLCRDILSATSSDLPYVLRCKYLKAKGTKFTPYTPGFNDFSDPFDIDEIVWPDEVRQVGEDFMRIADVWCEQMHHAFGIKMPKPARS